MELTLTVGERVVLLEVLNLAPPVDGVEPRPGRGLAGMAERVASYGGVLRVGREGSFWRVTAQLPLDIRSETEVA